MGNSNHRISFGTEGYTFQFLICMAENNQHNHGVPKIYCVQIWDSSDKSMIKWAMAFVRETTWTEWEQSVCQKMERVFSEYPKINAFSFQMGHTEMHLERKGNKQVAIDANENHHYKTVPEFSLRMVGQYQSYEKQGYSVCDIGFLPLVIGLITNPNIVASNPATEHIRI